jgi:hypothetical protein
MCIISMTGRCPRISTLLCALVLSVNAIALATRDRERKLA